MLDNEGRFQILATTELSQVNEALTLQLSSRHVNTIGGWVTEQLTHLPEEGEQLNAFGWNILVSRANSRRVVSLTFTKINESEQTQSD